MTCSKSSLFIAVFLLLMNAVYAQSHECRETRCGPDEPPIRFPFRLVGEINDHCGYPGFVLCCDELNYTSLELPTVTRLVKLRVGDINYRSQEIYVNYNDDNIHQYCLPADFKNLSLPPISPFRRKPFEPETDNITLFNCSTQITWSDCPIQAAQSSDDVIYSELLFCSKMYEVSPGPLTLLNDAGTLPIYGESYFTLKWSNPTCGRCEHKGKKCRFKNNTSQGEIECFRDRPSLMEKILKVILPLGGTLGAILLGLVILYTYLSFRMRGEDQARVEKFLEDYRALRPTRLSYKDIKRITNRFKDKLGEGAHGQVFKGELSNEIFVAVKILNSSDIEADGKEFINEVGTMGKIHHVNVARLLGYCADGFHRALVYEFFPNGSLQKFITLPDNDIFLGWDKLQKIALGIAKGVEYLHQGCDHQILHFDINPRNVLLDNDFIPKISDFGLAKLCPRNQSKVSMTAARGSLGYIAPEVFSRNFRNVSYKSDIDSYGMLLLEIVGGRKNMKTIAEETFEILYPEWIHNLLEGRDIHIHIENEEEIEIAKKLATVGLWCIQWHPMNRPSMKTVVQMLEGDANKLRVPPTPFDPAAPSTSPSTSGVIPARCLNFELEVIQELE